MQIKIKAINKNYQRINIKLFLPVDNIIFAFIYIERKKNEKLIDVLKEK